MLELMFFDKLHRTVTVGKVSTDADESVQIFSCYRVVLSTCGTDAF